MPPTNVDFLTRVDPFDPDEPFQIAYRDAIDRAQNGKFDSLQKQMRFFMLYQAARASVRRAPGADIIECGCYHGHSTYMLAALLKAEGFHGRFHVFDSFQGLSEFTPADQSQYYPTEDQRAAARKHFAASEDHVRRLLAPFDFIEIHPGWIPETFAGLETRPVSFLSVDVDLYEPTLAALQRFYPPLLPGGAVYLDDYGYNTFPGARSAVDGYLQATPHSQLWRMPFGSALLVK